MEWISVNDRLPEEYTDILISDRTYIFIGLYNGKIWLTKGANGYFLHSRFKPTHYMPLPEPPKQ